MNRGWSLNQRDWETLGAAISVRRVWISVPLLANEQSMVPEQPGVYAICAHPPFATPSDLQSLFNASLTPLYIGRSEANMRDRFLKHCNSPHQRLSSAKRCYHEGDLIFWYTVLARDDVKNAEALLIQCFGPPVNDRPGEFTIKGVIKPPVPA